MSKTKSFIPSRWLDLAERHRLSKIAGAGRVAHDPLDAALVAAVARRALRQVPWLVVTIIGLVRSSLRSMWPSIRIACQAPI